MRPNINLQMIFGLVINGLRLLYVCLQGKEGEGGLLATLEADALLPLHHQGLARCDLLPVHSELALQQVAEVALVRLQGEAEGKGRFSTRTLALMRAGW